jgi:hypothetical protein
MEYQVYVARMVEATEIEMPVSGFCGNNRDMINGDTWITLLGRALRLNSNLTI